MRAVVYMLAIVALVYFMPRPPGGGGFVSLGRALRELGHSFGGLMLRTFLLCLFVSAVACAPEVVPVGDDFTLPVNDRPVAAQPMQPQADRDGDGIPDAIDLCGDVPAGASPDPKRPGCPWHDSDGDGIADESDLCPLAPVGNFPDPSRKGCPLVDRDGDGLPDMLDKCPLVKSGPKPDPARPGCPAAVRYTVTAGDVLAWQIEGFTHTKTANGGDVFSLPAAWDWTANRSVTGEILIPMQVNSAAAGVVNVVRSVMLLASVPNLGQPSASPDCSPTRPQDYVKHPTQPTTAACVDRDLTLTAVDSAGALLVAWGDYQGSRAAGVSTVDAWRVSSTSGFQLPRNGSRVFYLRILGSGNVNLSGLVATVEVEQTAL